jgi:hypothetical protein
MKSFVTMIFYSSRISEDDTSEIKRLQKFLRRENLPIDADKYECTKYRAPFPDEMIQETPQLLDVPLLCEHRYTVVFSSKNIQRLHHIVSLVQSYAACTGIRSRIYSWKVLEDSQIYT